MALSTGPDGIIHWRKYVGITRLMMGSMVLIMVDTGKAKGFYTDTECQGAHVGVVSAHGLSILTPVFPPPSTLH